MLNTITTEPTPAQQQAWDRYVQARRDAGLPVAVEVQATDLRRGDVLAGGGTLTTDPSRHPCGVVVVEIDYTALRQWGVDQQVHIYERAGGSR